VLDYRQGSKTVNFDLSEEETMLEALADRFAAERYDIERRRTYQAQTYGFSQENWDMMGEFGLMAAPIAPERAGIDRRGDGHAVHGAGPGLVVEPLCESVLVGARLLLAGADRSLAAQWADDLCSGRRRVALAHCERARGGVAAIAQAMRISGEKHCGARRPWCRCLYRQRGRGAGRRILSGACRCAGPVGDALADDRRQSGGLAEV
jgi:hypothetical protein